MSSELIEQHLVSVPLFAVLDVGERRMLADRLIPRRVAKSQPIFLQGDPGDEMYVVLEGRVRICCESLSGREITLALLKDGGFFGDMALLDGEPRSATAIAETAGQLLVLRRQDFQAFLQSCPNAALALLDFLSRRLRVANEKIQDLALLTVRQRLAAMLVELAFKEGEPVPGGILLSPAVSHKVLSGLLGTSRETVSRMCAELKEQGLVEQQGRRLMVCRLEGLREIFADVGVR
jgi:CRP/FNR family cyclic AMP-dependent transcriptional regulator